MDKRVKTLYFVCPKCWQHFTIGGYWKWIFLNPFHTFFMRFTKCPHCKKRSLMTWYKITKYKE